MKFNLISSVVSRSGLPDRFVSFVMSIFNYDFDEVNCVQLVRMMIRNPHVASKNVRGTNLNDMFRDVLGICFFFKQRFYKPSYLCECAINIFTAIYTLCKYNYDCVPSWRVCA